MKMVGLAALSLTFVAAQAAVAAPPVVVLEDPRGDDHGPGAYVYPSGSEYRPGDFDLRRFEVRVEGKDAVIEVTLGANVRRNIVSKRGGAADLELDNGIYVQNIDVYIDTTDGAGFTQGLPGRRVAFPDESAWDLAIAITPRPGPLRRVLNDWNLEAANKVITPGPVRSSGPTMTVRVPLAQLGGAPQKRWGWSVMVSGAEWEQGFGVMKRITGTHVPDAFTLPVYGVPEERAFGGGSLGSGNPYVIDVILPKGRTQAQVLGTHSATSPAVVPMVYPDPERAKAVEQVKSKPSVPDVPRAPTADVPRRQSVAQTKSPSEKVDDDSGERLLKIASIDGDTVVIPNPEGGINTWQIGTVRDAEGRRQGRVVVTMVKDEFIVATVTDGKGAVQVGHIVRFARAD